MDRRDEQWELVTDLQEGIATKKAPAGHRSDFGRWVIDTDIYIACHFRVPRGSKILTRTVLDRPDRQHGQGLHHRGPALWL